MRSLSPEDASALACIAQYPDIEQRKQLFTPTIKDKWCKKVARVLCGLEKTKDKSVLEAVKGLQDWAHACRTVHAPPKRRR